MQVRIMIIVDPLLHYRALSIHCQVLRSNEGQMSDVNLLRVGRRSPFLAAAGELLPLGGEEGGRRGGGLSYYSASCGSFRRACTIHWATAAGLHWLRARVRLQQRTTQEAGSTDSTGKEETPRRNR